jgi:hypothetical protein
VSQRRPGGALRRILWSGLALWAVALAVVFVARRARSAPAPGDQLLAANAMGRRVDGQALSLLPADSVVAVLAATSECAACRVGVPAYREIASRLRESGVAFRVVVGSDSLAARQFSRLLGEPGAVVMDPGQKLLNGIGVRVVPSLYLVGRDGRLLHSWSPLTSDTATVTSIVGAARAAR